MSQDINVMKINLGQVNITERVTLTMKKQNKRKQISSNQNPSNIQ